MLFAQKYKQIIMDETIAYLLFGLSDYSLSVSVYVHIFLSHFSF
jgi:hypothetical protein